MKSAVLHGPSLPRMVCELVGKSAFRLPGFARFKVPIGAYIRSAVKLFAKYLWEVGGTIPIDGDFL